jgi:osmotically inducible protein OsmC
VKARSDDDRRPDGPEELTPLRTPRASMALSAGLAGPGRRLRAHTSATVTFQPGEGITTWRWRSRPRSQYRAGRFEEAAQTAKENCPVSKALLASESHEARLG